MGKREILLGALSSLRCYKLSDLESHTVMTQLLGLQLHSYRVGFLCCKSVLQNFSSLKDHPIIISQIRSLGLAQLVLCLELHKAEMKVSARPHSHLIDPFYYRLFRASSKLTEAVGRIEFLVV